MAETIFDKIISGAIPCHKVYEDDQVLAFLDINPLSHGHTLVIPKEPAETLDKMSEASGAALGRVLPRIAKAVLDTTGAEAYNVLQNNGQGAHQAVFHVHFHIIPKFSDGRSDGGLAINWKPGTLDSHVGADLAQRIAQRLHGCMAAPPTTQ